MPLNADSLILVANSDGSTYGGALPTFTDAANAVASIRPFQPGFMTGDGATVTQLTSKSTAVAINAICGRITTTSSALAAGSEVTFVVNNNLVAATDVPVVAIQSGGTAGSYAAVVSAVGLGSFSVTLTNLSTGSLSQALVLNFVIIKSVTN